MIDSIITVRTLDAANAFLGQNGEQNRKSIVSLWRKEQFCLCAYKYRLSWHEHCRQSTQIALFNQWIVVVVAVVV